MSSANNIVVMLSTLSSKAKNASMFNPAFIIWLKLIIEAFTWGCQMVIVIERGTWGMAPPGYCALLGRS